MTFDEIRKWEREEGREEGFKDGEEKGKLKLLIELIRKGRLTIAEAAEDSGFDEATIRRYLTE